MSEEMKEYTVEDVRNQIKPLSKNAFVRFFQRILRWWLGVWYGFVEKHPKLSSLIYKVFFFVVFSMGVTIWQFIVMAIVPMFLPKTGAVGWPMIPIAAAGGNNFIIFGDEQGWATFICFEIAVFTAQCINFPLQRNITYRSHGNPWYQAMWYFIGWVLVSIATNAIWGVCNAFLLYWGCPEIVNGLLKTVLTGGVSMVVFFFVFIIIFPDNNKMAKNAKAKYDKLVAANASPEKIEKAKAKMELWADKALRSNTEKDFVQARSLVNSKAMSYFALVKASEKAAAEAENAEKAAQTTGTDKAKTKAAKAREIADAYPEKLEKSFAAAVEAIKHKNEKETIYVAVKETDALPETVETTENAAPEKIEEPVREEPATDSAKEEKDSE